MFDLSITILDWIGIIAFAASGALVASRKEMDVVGFVLLGTVTGIGGGTLRDVILDSRPVVWLQEPAYLSVCVATSIFVFFFAPLVASRYRLLLWLDAVGLATFATAGAAQALALGQSPLVSVTMGVITACFGGIIRDMMGNIQPSILTHEIYVTAALLSAVTYVALINGSVVHEVAVPIALASGFCLRAGGLKYGWSLPRYRSRPARR